VLFVGTCEPQDFYRTEHAPPLRPSGAASTPLRFAPILLQCFAIWMRCEPLTASEMPYFPAFAIICHMKCRIRTIALSILSYGSITPRSMLAPIFGTSEMLHWGTSILHAHC
jgi:hypothetical protein